MRPRIVLALLSLALVAFPAGTASADASHSHRHSTRPAARALHRAQALFAHPTPGHARRRSTGAAPAHGRDASMLLRDLALHLRGLAPADRRTAERILARPSDGAKDEWGFGYTAPERTPTCNDRICVHSVDAAPGTNPDAATPEQVQTTLDVFDHVWQTEVTDMGYQAPKSDLSSTNNGGDGRLDVYLADTGAQKIYGYCTTDDPAASTRRDVSGYCVVDNDFATSQLGGASPLASLEVTAAHEFFHAVQFSYDVNADLWFMESTAAWIEDEVYDDVNDNFQFLRVGPLGHPNVPLDYFDPDPSDSAYYPQYGGWVFWKYVSETYGADTVKLVWQKAAQTYSLAALRSVLAARDVDLTQMFAKFGAVNRYPGRYYSEGAHYPRAPLAKRFLLTRHRRAVKPVSADLNHLSNLTVRFKHTRTLHGAPRLRLRLDMADRDRGSAATVVVHLRDGRISRRPVHLDRRGDGHKTVPFSRSRVSYVELTLTDASTRYACGKGDYRLSCSGLPKDDGVRATFAAKAVR